MAFVITLLVFVTVYLAVIAVHKVLYANKLVVEKRLGTYTAVSVDTTVLDDALDRPFVDRVIRPILEKLATMTTRSMPAKKRISLHHKLMMAGNPWDLTPNEFMVIQYGIVLGLPALVVLVLVPLGTPFSKVSLFAIGAAIVGTILPEYLLKLRAARRQEEIQKTLPDVLDLLTVSVEAGLGFDAALVKVVEKTQGVLSVEFHRVLQESKMGKPRRDALRDLATRTGVEDLAAFVGAIIQADQLGVSIGNVLRLQSEQMRLKRRQRAEEKAMKAPIKMLIPMVIFIFPTIFIVLIGPALIEIVESM